MNGAAARDGEDAPRPSRYAPNVGLPDGAGRALLERACTTCHDLAGIDVQKVEDDARLEAGEASKSNVTFSLT